VRRVDRARSAGPTLDTDTILESYPGVTNTPAIDEAFVGRIDELERLQQVLVSANRPSPVLLTGMRRIGKTSLLLAFHRKYSQSTLREAATFYLSLAERRVELAGAEQTVAATIFRAISHALVRQNLTAADLNHDLCTRIRTHFGGDWRAARKVIQECYDEESLADSLMALCARLLQWLGEPTRRIILLIDEAEVLVAPYHIGGRKKLELEQLLQSLREVSQTTGATISMSSPGSTRTPSSVAVKWWSWRALGTQRTRQLLSHRLASPLSCSSTWQRSVTPEIFARECPSFCGK
jgi:AAA ATPase domain